MGIGVVRIEKEHLNTTPGTFLVQLFHQYLEINGIELAESDCALLLHWHEYNSLAFLD